MFFARGMTYDHNDLRNGKAHKKDSKESHKRYRRGGSYCPNDSKDKDKDRYTDAHNEWAFFGSAVSHMSLLNVYFSKCSATIRRSSIIGRCWGQIPSH